MSSEDNHLVKHVTDRWNNLNKNLEHVPKFQNKSQTGVKEEDIQEFEKKFNIHLPKEIREVIKIHNGRQHIGYGLGYRLPTTDLLPLSQWKPYEKDNDDFSKDLFECLIDTNDGSADKNLREDAREHLNAFIKNHDLTKNDLFQSLPSELLIIGQGMDDYAEQYLLSVRSGRIYLAVHNIPEWKLIGTFNDWIEKGLNNINEQSEELKEQHDEIED